MKNCKIFFMLTILLVNTKISAITLMIPDTSGTIGSSIHLPIIISDTSNTEIAGADILISYNSNILDVIVVNNTTLTSGFLISDSICVDRIAISLARSTGIPITSGELLEIVFQIKNTANVNSTSQVTFIEANLYGENYISIPLQLINGSITVSSMPESIQEQLTVLPNPFTPNNDNYNDVVYFNLSSDMIGIKTEIQIFDISGKLVRKNNQDLSWNGLDNNGNSLKPGVYIYIIKINNQTKYNGTITLIR
jgi:gliding motility-associated-like protein